MSVISKRQQARNERALHDLIKSVPGNDKCADCAAKNPGWASWSLGIFLCMRCAALHRKLGTHISKVKSLSMDSWSGDQVDNMRRIGNATSNRSYNARNIKPAIPMDIDEVDGVMERYIRQKYETKTLTDTFPTAVHRTGSSSSDLEERPQLPPKPSKRFTFGLRSSSSTFPASRPGRSPPLSPRVEGFSFHRKATSPAGRNKPAKIFGADIGGSRQDNYELKLIALREMGFPDDKRNLTILKGENGNVDRAVATLIRLGECSKVSSGRSSPIPETPPKDEVPGISIKRSSKSISPFDALDLNEKALPPPPVEEQQSNAYNPFLQPSKPIEQSFQGLQLSPPSQLFPNATGGYSMNQPHINTNPFLQTYTPPPHPMAGNTGPFAAPPVFSQPPVAAPNPFLRPSHSQTFPSTNPFGSNTFSAPLPSPFNLAPQFPQQQFLEQTPSAMSMSPSHSFTVPQPAPGNPFQQPAPLQTNLAQSHFASTLTQSPIGGPFQQQMQPQQSPISGSFQQMQSQQSPTSGSFQQMQPQQSQLSGSFQQQMQPQAYDTPFSQQNAYPVQRTIPPGVDKSSILALYSMGSQNQSPNTDRPQLPQGSPFQKRSVTMPLARTGAVQPAVGGLSPIPQAAVAHSPFHSPATVASSTAGASYGFVPSPQPQRVSMAPAGVVLPPNAAAGLSGPRPNHESVDFTTLMAGRHSPDMFAGLSARIVTR